MTAPYPGAQVGREASAAPRASSRPGRLLLGILLLPGGLLLVLGIGIAWAGLVLLTPWLRRLTTANAGTSVAPGLTCHRDSRPAPQPHGEPHEPRPRVWLAPPSLEVH